MSDHEHDHDPDPDPDDPGRAVSGDLLTMLRTVEPPAQHAPADADALWSAGRRRARRTRVAWIAATAAGLLVVAVLAASTTGRDGDVSLRVADSVPGVEPVDTTAPVEPAPSTTVADPEPGPTAPPDVGSSSIPGFPASIRINRTVFVAGGDPLAEIGLVPVDADARAGVTVAIPFTFDVWDPLVGAWQPTIDLYDMSGGGDPHWDPHGRGSAWYVWTNDAFGFPIRVPVVDVPLGTHRICVQAWRTEDGAPRPDDDVVGGEVDVVAELAIPESSVRLCVAIELVAATSAEPAILVAPDIEIERVGVRTPLLGAADADPTVGAWLVGDSPRPGEPGTAIVLGHRTTWSAPFADLDQLAAGDRVVVTDADQRLEFEVVATRVVPAAGPVEAPTFGIPADELAPTDDPTPRLRLVTFAPRYSAAERLIVDTVLVDRWP
jgi:sortase (surface protein transpeptidase)